MTSRSRILVTGFGPFANITDNPSATLARECGAPNAVLTVSYSAVDDWLRNLDSSAFDALLLMGVAAGRPYVSLETRAQNRLDGIAGSDGIKPDRAEIEPGGIDSLPGTLWSDRILLNAGGDLAESNDAGGYLCNYVYYRALKTFPDKRIGFLHVASFDNVSKCRQKMLLTELLRQI